MLVIRNEQMAVFEEQTWKPFVEMLYAAMMKGYPGDLQEIGEEGVRNRVDRGLQQADENNISERRNLKRLIHLLFVFGVDEFGPSTGTEWASTVLGWQTDEDKKLSLLEHRAQKMLYPD